MIKDEQILQAASLHHEAPAPLLAIAKVITSFASGRTSFEEYQAILAVWWEHNKDTWQPDDLARLFRLICLSD